MQSRSRALLEKPVGPLIIEYALPAMAGMMIMALYNVVDAIFVGKYVGKLGIAGIAVVLPYHTMLLAVAQLIALGGASVISRSIGAGSHHRMQQAFNTSIFLGILLSIVVTALSLVFIQPMIYLFGATDAIYPYAYEYLVVTIWGSVTAIYIMISNNMIRSEGSAKVAMLSMMISAIANIVLDAVFIIGLDMGMRGAAIATVISQIIACIYAFLYFQSRDSHFQHGWKYVSLEKPLLMEIFSIGSAGFARQIGASVMNILVNQSLRIYGGELMIAAYGIIMRLLMFAVMPIFGIVQGMMPVLGMNYGAGAYKRSVQAIDASNKFATLFSVGAFLLFLVFPRPLVGLFTNEEDLITYTAQALILITLAFPTVGYQTVGSSLFQSLGRGLPSFFLSLLRQVIFLLPLIYFLPRYFGASGILYSFAVADVLAFLITYFVVKSERYRILQQIGSEQEDCAIMAETENGSNEGPENR